MLRTEGNNYRRAFWIALTTTVVFAIVASVLWWRLSHASTASQPGASSASESMEAMAQTSSANASGSEQGAGGDPQAGNMQETPLAPFQLTPQRMQSIGMVLGKVESKPVNTELRFYGNVQVDERRQAYVQTRFAGWIRKVYADATGNFAEREMFEEARFDKFLCQSQPVRRLPRNFLAAPGVACEHRDQFQTESFNSQMRHRIRLAKLPIQLICQSNR